MTFSIENKEFMAALGAIIQMAQPHGAGAE
jgi:hypothetical protein